jgi:hypothetical protein
MRPEFCDRKGKCSECTVSITGLSLIIESLEPLRKIRDAQKVQARSGVWMALKFRERDFLGKSYSGEDGSRGFLNSQWWRSRTNESAVFTPNDRLNKETRFSRRSSNSPSSEESHPTESIKCKPKSLGRHNPTTADTPWKWSSLPTFPHFHSSSLEETEVHWWLLRPANITPKKTPHFRITSKGFLGFAPIPTLWNSLRLHLHRSERWVRSQNW